jgi:hypothetical protein
MKSVNVTALFLMVPALALGSVGCGSKDANNTTTGDDAFTSSGGLQAELGGAIGALVVNGERLCTAALIEADAGATIQVNGVQVSAEGRQIAFGGACVGKLSENQKDFVGAAAFASLQNGVSVSTPIIGFDFQSKASAGLAIGILADKSQAKPMALAGIAADADVGGQVGAIVRANDKDGLIVGAGFQLQGGFDVAFSTQCASFEVGAAGSVGANASLQLKGGDDAAAIIQVNGEFQFVANLDVQVNGQCVVARTLDDIDQFGQQLNSAGIGNIVSMQYHPTGRGTARFSVYLDQPAYFIRINSAGDLTGTTDGVVCRKFATTGAPCSLYAQDGFDRGWHTIDVDIELSLFANPQKGQLVVFSTADTPFN